MTNLEKLEAAARQELQTQMTMATRMSQLGSMEPTEPFADHINKTRYEIAKAQYEGQLERVDNAFKAYVTALDRGKPE